MDQPGQYDLHGDRQAVLNAEFAFLGYDLTGATFAMQVRDRKDGGALRADLATVTSAVAQGVRLVYAGTDTIANHIAAGHLDADQVPDGYEPGDSEMLSSVTIRINKSVMQAMPFPAEIGEDIDLPYDLHVDPSGADDDVYIAGLLIVRAGVTE